MEDPIYRSALHASTSWLQGGVRLAKSSITHPARLLNRPENDDISVNAAQLPRKELANDRLSYSNGTGTLSLNCYNRGGAERAQLTTFTWASLRPDSSL